jgi:hypothetical protein
VGRDEGRLAAVAAAARTKGAEKVRQGLGGRVQEWILGF